jgi:hypothetical protein
MEGKPGYENLWAIATSAIIVEPTTAIDVIQWLNAKSHLGDARCATAATVAGKQLRVVKRNGRYDLIPV